MFHFFSPVFLVFSLFCLHLNFISTLYYLQKKKSEAKYLLFCTHSHAQAQQIRASFAFVRQVRRVAKMPLGWDAFSLLFSPHCSHYTSTRWTAKERNPNGKHTHTRAILRNFRRFAAYPITFLSSCRARVCGTETCASAFFPRARVPDQKQQCIKKKTVPIFLLKSPQKRKNAFTSLRSLRKTWQKRAYRLAHKHAPFAVRKCKRKLKDGKQANGLVMYANQRQTAAKWRKRRGSTYRITVYRFGLGHIFENVWKLLNHF